MKKDSKKSGSRKAEQPTEYNFTGGVRGKYAGRYAEGTNIVVLAPDVARRFGDSETVNRVLRACDEILTSVQKAQRVRRSR